MKIHDFAFAPRVKHVSLLLGVLVGLAAGFAPAASRAGQGEGGSFVERFDAIDAARWYASDGWNNGDYQNCTWSALNIKAGDGGLTLKLRDGANGDRAYSCAEIQTHAVFGYGVYEVRMRPAKGSGLVSAFFSYVGPYGDPTKPHDEIDFEFLGKDTGGVQLNYFAEAEGGNEHIARFDFDAADTVADYAFEWRPDAIRWFVNGEMVREAKRQPGKPFPVTPSKIILSLWNGAPSGGTEAWLGRFVYPGEPLIARYERVAFTKAGDRCQFPESVVCKLQKADSRLGPAPSQR